MKWAGPHPQSLPRQLRDMYYEDVPLTDREKQVLRLTALGYTSAEAGKKLFLGYETIKQYKKRILSKLKAKNITQAVAIAISLDLI